VFFSASFFEINTKSTLEKINCQEHLQEIGTGSRMEFTIGCINSGQHPGKSIISKNCFHDVVKPEKKIHQIKTIKKVA
jgi:hypothetical protein